MVEEYVKKWIISRNRNCFEIVVNFLEVANKLLFQKKDKGKRKDFYM